MRPWIAVSVALAACGGPTAPAPGAPRAMVRDAGPVATAPEPDASRPFGIDWTTVPHATDEEALAIWRALGLTGDSWEVLLGEIPADAYPVREAMAKALLREGNFACPSVDIGRACEPVPMFREIAPADDLNSPCLRRMLALWALDELSGPMIETELAPDAIALAGLPPPEDEINRYVLQKISDEPLRLQMLAAAEAAGNENVADENLAPLSMKGVEEAAALHIDGAVEVLDVSEAVGLYSKALVDPLLRTPTRIRVAYELAGYGAALMPDELDHARIRDALRAGAADPDCAVAAAATAGLASLDGVAMAVPPKNAKAPALVRAICLALLSETDSQAFWKATVGARGITLRGNYTTPDEASELEDPDPAEDPPARGATDIERLPRERIDELRQDSDLLRALEHCTGTECRAPGSDLLFRFHFKKSGGRLLLDTIERTESPTRC